VRLAELAGGTVLIGSAGEFTEWSPAVGSRDGPAAWNGHHSVARRGCTSARGWR